MAKAVRLQPNLTSKAAFSRLAGVTPGRVSQWISEGALSGAALVRDGRAERIDVEVARRQLGRRLGADQRIPAGRGGGADRGDTLNLIQRQRLAALELANERTRAAAMADAGRYIRADDVKQQLGAVAARLMSAFEASFMPIANAIVAGQAQTPQDVLRIMRTTWREAQAAKAQGEEALVMPPLVESDADAVSQP